MNIYHKHFIQFMLKNGCVTLEDALDFYKTITEDSLLTSTNIKQLITEINPEISQQFFQLTLATCEITNQSLILWLNTKNDNINKFQSSFTQIELEYFHMIMKDIIESDEHKVTFPFCLNITSSLKGGSLTRDNGQKVLNRWIKGGYLVKVAGDVYLGMRTILEFTTSLQPLVPDSVCGLCSDLMFIGETCLNCDKIFHKHCLGKYLLNHKTCPQCKRKWQNTRQSQESVNDSRNVSGSSRR